MARVSTKMALENYLNDDDGTHNRYELSLLVVREPPCDRRI